MKPLWEQAWFINTIAFCRESALFERWIWGYSKNMEDLCRNPAEELRDNFPPFAFMNVKRPTSILLLRIGLKPFKQEREQEYFDDVISTYPRITPDMIRGSYKIIPLDHVYLNGRIGLWNPWVTKYPNAGLMFQLLVCWKWGFIPIPFISLGIRFSKVKFFQFGAGWSPQWRNYNGRYPGDTSTQAVMSGACRFGDFLDDIAWNPGSIVYGYWEGGV